MLKKQSHQGYTEFFIFAEKEISLLQAFKELTKKLSNSYFSRKTAPLSEIVQATDVKSYFEAWGWKIETDSLGNIQDIAQVAPDMDTAIFMLTAIAPYVSPGCFIILSDGEEESATRPMKLCFNESGFVVHTLSQRLPKKESTSELIAQALELVNKAVGIAANNRIDSATRTPLENALETARASLVEASQLEKV